MSKTNISKQKTLLLVQNALLISIVLLMAFTPLGYLKIGVVEMTLIMIPVAVGGIALGEKTGAVLGLVFGITSFYQCINGSSFFGAALLSISPIYTFIMCIVPRVLMGFCCGLLFKALKKAPKAVGYSVAALSAPVVNTLLFVGSLILFFGNSTFIAELKGDLKLIPFIVTFVGLNGLLEIILTGIVAPPIAAALEKAVKKFK